jgi:hypothetical protein
MPRSRATRRKHSHIEHTRRHASSLSRKSRSKLVQCSSVIALFEPATMKLWTRSNQVEDKEFHSSVGICQWVRNNCAGSVDRPGEFVGREGTPILPAISLNIHPQKRGQRGVANPPLPGVAGVASAIGAITKPVIA